MLALKSAGQQATHKQFAQRLRRPQPLTPAEFDEGFASANYADYQEGYRAFVEKRDWQ